MKKSILFSIAIIAAIAANAQIQFGVKAGVNLANINATQLSSTESFKSSTSFHAGGLVSIPLFSNFVLQPEIVYSGEGAKYNNDGDVYTINTGYVNIPVLFKYKDPSGFFAELGPQFGILASAKMKLGSVTQDAKSSFKSTDVSGCVGIGYLSSLNIGIDARYSMGLTDIMSSSSGSTGTAKNNVIQIGLFYMFGGKK
jgi:hypothetical protein